ncbi:RNA polymerase sigma factor [Nakamurella sp. A5-74]|uniref:RNA polymerase sigma factor n=1 Tax=Nakamurella sp. A5-74 TaxID=3158264 RepID=A0AAU8DUB0_9ACTN
MYRLALAMTGNSHVAEDISHDLLLKLWSAQPATELTWPYIRAAVANAVYDQHRRSTDRLRILRTNADELGSASDPTTDRDIEASIDVQRALARLPGTHRLVIVLHYLEDLPFHEVAAILQRPPGTIRRIGREAVGQLTRDLTPTEREN